MERNHSIPLAVIANTILIRAKERNVLISPMKLQKLIYILYGYFLAKTDSVLFSDEFEAWKYGPVLPNIYHEFKAFNNGFINKLSSDADGAVYYIDNNNEPDNVAFYKIFDEVWCKYSNYSAVDLSNLTHVPNSPWDKAVKNGTYLLSRDDIKQSFLEAVRHG